MNLDDTTRLNLIKLAHTLIWLFFVSVIGYLVYAGISGNVSWLAWCAMGLIIFEGIVLLLNNGKCPLTPMAARYTTAREENFDIFLPRWLAKHNKSIFSTIAAIGGILVLYRVLH